MAEKGGQERTEQPTPKRLNDAREKGQIARSRELNTTAVLMTGAAGMLFLGDNLMQGISGVMAQGLTVERPHIFDTAAMLQLLEARSIDALLTLVPLFTLLVVAAFLSPMVLGGFSFSTKALAFKWDKLDPIKGLGRVFAVRGLVELLKALGKFLIIGGVTVTYLWFHIDDFLQLGGMGIEDALARVGDLLFWSFLAISSALIMITLLDVPFQLWDHNRQLMMTMQEVKDENKETEGHPEVKQHVRNLQQQMAERRMMQDVPNADVVVTNPSHYAVALKYDQNSMGAPRVIAKGADLIAAEIRNVAHKHNVPVATAPPLTRALFYSTELNDEIPAGLYLAVAQVLAYIYQLRERRSYKPNTTIELPDVDIPDDLRHD
ncbi:flagellar biosynthesis protein FlhB [Sulfuriflexus sp.]|uniref:flagellar biosynthesis protein FlhB n=1 Tax=Sulfuriflexus sp. TaxID=2015443 RepID=UPI0028CCC17F|nr:flagellar biosynthesis protein FlhB [Sulfuriflexus sp.]MDT8403917.1 flagellar biosynthesis protein FlhB [Sulfuriflexus sp.]